MMSIRADGAWVEQPRPFVTLRDNADRNQTFTTASKPSFSQAHPAPSSLGQVGDSGDQLKVGRVRRFADPMGKAGIMADMLKQGLFDPSVRGIEGFNGLQRACRQGANEVVEALIEHSKRSGDNNMTIDARSKMTPTPLCIAAEEGNLELLTYLLEEGDDPNFWDANRKRTALMAAVSENKRDAMICLLKNGATFGMPMSNTAESSVVTWAIESKDYDMVKLLLKRCIAGFEQGKVDRGPGRMGAVQMKRGIVERVLKANPSETPDKWGKLVKELIAESHAGLIGLKWWTQEHPASAIGTVRSVDVMNGGDLTTSRLENCIPYIAIADLPLLRMPSEKLWSYDKNTDPLPLQIFNQLVSAILFRVPASGNFWESLIRHLHEQHVLTAVALYVADCLVKQHQWLGLHVGPDAFSNERQKAIYYAAALSIPAELIPFREKFWEVYMKAGISTEGAEQLAIAAERQFIELQDLVVAVINKLDGEMLTDIMPACLQHTNCEYEVNVSSLATRLVATGMIRPIAVAVSESWQTAISSLRDKPLALPSGATFKQFAQIMGDAMNKVARPRFAATLQAELCKWNVESPFRVMSFAANADDALNPLFQRQIGQLKEYCSRLIMG